MSHTPSRLRRIGIWALAVAILASAALIARRPPPKEAGPLYAAVFEEAAAAARVRNETAEKELERAFDIAWALHIENLRRASSVTATELGTYKSTATFAWLSMKDKATGAHRAEERLHERFDTALSHETALLAADMSRQLAAYGLALSSSTVMLAHDVAQPLPGASAQPADVSPVSGTSGQIGTAMTTLAVRGMLLPLDVAGVASAATPLANLVGRASSLAASLFAREAAATTAAGTVAAVSGPIPIVDFVAVGLVGWSAVDIYHARVVWGEAMDREARRLVDEIGSSARERTFTLARDMKNVEMARQRLLLDAAQKGGT